MARWKPEKETWWVDCRPLGFGLTIYALFDKTLPFPLGLVWGQTLGKVFLVYYSFILPWARRMGVRTKMNEEIFRYHRVIRTGGGTKGGLAFLKAKHYRYDKVSNEWYLVKRGRRHGE